MDAQKVMEFLKVHDPEIMFGFMIPVSILRAWYPCGSNPEHVFKVLQEAGLPIRMYTIGIMSYMHMIGGDHPELPEELQRFLKESPEMLVPMLSTFWQTNVNYSVQTTGGGTLTADGFDQTVKFIGISPLLTASQCEQLEILEKHIPVMLVSEAVAERARQLLETNEVTERHPAFDFVNKIIEQAKHSASLPTRAKEIVGLIF